MLETFTYDRLSRLTSARTRGDIGSIAYDNTSRYSYDGLGNMLSKSDVGNYLYG